MSTTPIYDGLRAGFYSLRTQNVEPAEVRMSRATFKALCTELHGDDIFVRTIASDWVCTVDGVRVVRTD